jgi:hypothetical protein
MLWNKKKKKQETIFGKKERSKYEEIKVETMGVKGGLMRNRGYSHV